MLYYTFVMSDHIPRNLRNHNTKTGSDEGNKLHNCNVYLYSLAIMEIKLFSYTTPSYILTGDSIVCEERRTSI